MDKQQQIDHDQNGNIKMTARTVKHLCALDGILQAPQLIDKLYLYEKGFKKIQPLQMYKNVVSLWLNGNQLTKIENLEQFPCLVCLYLNNNRIEKIEGLETLKELEIINFQKNKIIKVEGLGHLKKLKNLNLAENYLKTSDSIKELVQLKRLVNLDFSKNELQNQQQMFTVIKSLQSMACLSLKATPFARGYKNYRKHLIAVLPNLKSLDDRPVQESEHRLCEAWLAGGAENEKNQRNRIKAQEKNKKIKEKDEQGEAFYKNIVPIVSSEKKSLSFNENKSEKGPKAKQNKEDLIQSQKKTQNEQQKIEEQTEPIQIKAEQPQKRPFDAAWLTPYSRLLQALLQKYQFDFSQVQPRLNMIISNLNKKLSRTTRRFEIPELQKIWTTIQQQRRKQNPL